MYEAATDSSRGAYIRTALFLSLSLVCGNHGVGGGREGRGGWLNYLVSNSPLPAAEVVQTLGHSPDKRQLNIF